MAHDAGKGREEWQRYLKIKSGYDEEAHLEGKAGKVPHAIYGAKLAEQHFERSWQITGLMHCRASCRLT